MKRVVVTGYGAVSPLGINTELLFQNLIASKSGISKIESFDASSLQSQIAGEIKPYSESNPLGFNPQNYVPFKDIKKMDKFMVYAMAATEEALNMANWHPKEEESLIRTGVVVGSGIGGLSVIEETVKKIYESELKGSPFKVSPFFIPSSLINLASGHISIKYGFLGPNQSTVTACATGAHGIYNAAQMIMLDDADVVVCGGAESSICKTGILGFNASHALSTKFNATPEKASRPWDQDRDGFVMSEGAGILILEEYEHAKKRGATILAEYSGCGLSGDAFHITAPEENGRGAKNALKMALKKAKISKDQIDYINAHGTSTPLGDKVELNAVKEVLYSDKKLDMSSTKSSTGHLLGAAGSLEAVISIMAMQKSIIPPTINLENPLEEAEEFFDLIPNKPKEKEINYCLSNSFGFGGTNVSLIFKKFK